MTQDELKLALDALERSVATCFDQYAHQQVMSQPDHFINKAITAIKEALAQPEQEPVAWVQNVEFDQLPEFAFSWVETSLHNVPLYTSPPPQRTWVGLTDEEMRKICGSVATMREAVREAESILKEGNT